MIGNSEEQPAAGQSPRSLAGVRVAPSGSPGSLKRSIEEEEADSSVSSRGGDKRQKLDLPAARGSGAATSSRVIVPSVLSHRTPSPSKGGPDQDDPDVTDDELDIPVSPAALASPLDPPILPETYEILPPARRINPATSLSELLIRNQASSSAAPGQARQYSPTASVDELLSDNYDYTLDYLPPPLTKTDPQASTSTTIDLTEAPSPPASPDSSASTPLPSPPGGSLGSTLTSAILIGDSPTPPLRPIASPKARLEASANGRCNVFAGEEDTKTEDRANEKEEAKVTLGELVCPICLGPPTPLVLSQCGHAFCGPCLHSALTSQPITQETLRALPNIAGKELEGTCPVCRHPLAGGWGKSLRGAILRMAEVELPVE